MENSVMIYLVLAAVCMVLAVTVHRQEKIIKTLKDSDQL